MVLGWGSDLTAVQPDGLGDSGLRHALRLTPSGHCSRHGAAVDTDYLSMIWAPPPIEWTALIK